MSSPITVHNPPVCTCQRIKWLAANCETFNLTVTGSHADIEATLGNMGHCYAYAYVGPVDQLAEIVGDCFADCWDYWTPETGIKA